MLPALCLYIIYSKRRRGCEAFSIHPFIPSSIHGWHHVTHPSIRPVIHPWMASRDPSIHPSMDGIIQGSKPWQK